MINQTEEFIAVLKRYQCVGVYIELKKDLPVTVGKEYQTGKKAVTANLIDLINAEDLTVVLTRIEELSMLGSGSLRVNCRFIPENKQYLICCEMRREKRLGKTSDYLFGVIMDVAEFNKNMDSDPTQQELLSLKKNLNKFSPSDAAGYTGIIDIIGREQLSRMQLPLNKNYGLSSAILTEKGKFICSSDPKQTEFDIRNYKHSRQLYIKINNVVFAEWVIVSDDVSLIEWYSPVHDVLVENLSTIANSYVMLYNEMVNTEHANKLLSEIVEQQMLLSGIYNKVLNERNTISTARAVVDLTGDFLKLDRIIIYENVSSDEKYKLVYERALPHKGIPENPPKNSEVFRKSPKEFNYSDYPELIEELDSYETYYSNNPEHDVLGLDFSSYVASNLSGDGSKFGIIIYVVNNHKRVLTHAEKRLLRSVSQIIAAVVMRCKDNEKLDISNNRLHELAYHDHQLGIKNRTSLSDDIQKAIKSGKSGAVVAFKMSNIKYINNFEGHDYTDRLLMKILNSVYEYELIPAEPYRFSDKIFMVLLRNADVVAVKEFCDMLKERFGKPWNFEGKEHYLGFMAGVAPYPNAGNTSEELYRAAEIAMDKAKGYETSSYAFYSGEFEPSRSDDYHCAQILREAVENNMGGIVAEYTPVYSSEKGERKIVSYEAVPLISQLIDSEIYSSQIIMRIAEKMGIDSVIDAWLIHKACEFCFETRLDSPEVTVSVSVSALSLISGEIVPMVKNALEKSNLPSKGLALQFSERIVAMNYDQFIKILSELKKMEVPVILDNLGSYYVTSELVRHSGISALKADVTVFTGGFEDEFGEHYISELMKLAKANGVSVGVRSIENQSQLDVELIQGADWYQGNFYTENNAENEKKVGELV